MSIAILGAGVMGSAMCPVFADRGHRVSLVGTHLDDAIIDSVRQSRLHPKLSVALSDAVTGHHHNDFARVAEHADLILLGVASAGVPWAIDMLAGALTKPKPIVMITKGMQPFPEGLAAFPDVIADALEKRLGFKVPVAGIAGPCIAGELAVRRATGTVIVSRDAALAENLCAAFATDYYTPRPSTDMAGVEACAAFKNFFAIAVGWAHGRMDVMAETENRARNNNPAAILFAQSVRELMVIVKALGGTEESVWGMPGVGDLYVTCQAGRNSRLGNALGRGLTYAEVKAGPMKNDTIEGAELGRAVAPSLRAMVHKGKLDAGKIPLTLALLDTLTRDAPLDPPWSKFG